MAMLSTLSTLGIVWLAIAAITAIAVSLGWHRAQKRIARWHAIDRGRAALISATAPAVVPTVLVGILLAPGLLGLLVPSLDHCARHPDHPHLCLVHPAALAPAAFVAAGIAVGAAAILAVGLSWRRSWREASSLRGLGALAKPPPERYIDIVDSERPFAFTFGFLRARSLVSTALLRALRPDQAEFVLRHEAEHARRRDPLRQLVARICSVPIPSSVRRAILAELVLSAEQSCDEHAARNDPDRLLVAETILVVERLLSEWGDVPHVAPSGIGGGSIAARVQALTTSPIPRASVWVDCTVAVSLMLVLAARPFHHEIEHLLSLIF